MEWSRGKYKRDVLAGKYGEASVAGYTQSPGGFGSPAASQGADKKGVSLPQLRVKPVREMCLCICDLTLRRNNNTHAA